MSGIAVEDADMPAAGFITILLVYRFTYFIYFGYRKYTKGITMFQSIGPLLLLSSLQALNYLIIYKKLYKDSTGLMLSHLLLIIVAQLSILLFEKQFSQTVYQLTVVMNLSYVIQQLTNDSILYNAQILYHCYLLYQIIKHKNYQLTRKPLFFIMLMEGILTSILSFYDTNISILAGVVKIAFTFLLFGTRNAMMDQAKKIK